MLQPGFIVGGRYVVAHLLGGGGMKQVWLARDKRLGERPCALAEMIDAFADLAVRTQAEAAFKREAELLASLSNEHIPQVYDSFSESNAHYLVMEYIEGKTLEEELKGCGGSMKEEQATAIVLQIADTLRYLHSLKPPVIYRDLKPSNVIIKASGRVMLVDFGIARHFSAPKTMTMIGTPGYAAPEQWKGKAEPRSDVYAAGALLHQMLSGRDPTTEPPCSFPPIEQLVPHSTPELAALVNDSLAYDLNKRVPSIVAFRKRLAGARKAAVDAAKAAQAAQAATIRVPPPVKPAPSPTIITLPPKARVRPNPLIALLYLIDSLPANVLALVVVLGIFGVLFLIGLVLRTTNPPEREPVHEASPIAALSPAPVTVPTPFEVTGPAPTATPETPPHREETAASGSESTTRGKACDRHFEKGWTRDLVSSAQGAPESILGQTWWYRSCWVHFVDGRVDLFGGPWRVPVAPPSAAMAEATPRLPALVRSRPVRHHGYFTVGSTKDEVLAAQGTPDSFTDNSFRYGLSTVRFANNRVVGWDNYSSSQLRAELLPKVRSERTNFTIGSARDEVLSVQGTPDSFTENSFRYGLSTVYFENGRVVRWDNYSSSQLKVRMETAE